MTRPFVVKNRSPATCRRGATVDGVKGVGNERRCPRAGRWERQGSGRPDESTTHSGTATKAGVKRRVERAGKKPGAKAARKDGLFTHPDAGARLYVFGR
jgi:hypothetical protein